MSILPTLFQLSNSSKKELKRPRFHQVLTFLLAMGLGISAGILSYTQILYVPDEYITNYIYTYNPFEKADERITIAAIDEESENAYGAYEEWSRELLAQTVTALKESGAAVIALDTDLSKESDASGDLALANACKSAGNVIALASADFDTAPDRSVSPKETNEEETNTERLENGEHFLASPADSSMKWTEHKAVRINYPYQALADCVTVGIGNAVQQSMDGTIRSAALTVNFDNIIQDSFAAAVYKAYQDYIGADYAFPDLNNQKLFGFNTIFQTSTYKIISLADILSGNYDPHLFKDQIVLIGEFDSEEQASNYFEYLRSGASRQEVLVESAILQALITSNTVTDINPAAQAVLYGFLISFFYFLLAKRKTILTIIAQVIFIFCGISIAYILNLQGYRLLLLVPILFMIASMFLHLLQNLLYTALERRRMENTLKMYVDSQVVDEITEVAPFALSSMSERKHIAVLFVDIRGFTTLSESLEPEQVVEILDRYFSVVYASITAWNGTLDKFIGDAAMAIFNAPKDLDDYVFHAVCAADDIMKGFEEMKTHFKNRYNADVNVGIGINCGEAIVGNIGCIGRMDYTAIGDTVNTASRLESRAAPGQILISDSVQKIIAPRVTASSIGALALKGKANTVETYQIDSIEKPEAPNSLGRKEFLLENRLLYTKIRPNR